MRGLRTLIFFALSLSGGGAAAQGFERAADERGMRIGVWRFEPVIEAGFRHDGNIFREETGGQASLIATLAPSATLRSDWRRHSAAITGRIEAGFYTASPSDDWLDGEFGFEGIVDATRATRIRFRAGAARGHEARGGDDAPLSLAEPIRFTNLTASLAVQYAPGRLRLQPSLAWGRLNFRDTPLLNGGVSDQDDRNRDTMSLALLAGWRVSRKTEAFADIRLTSTDFNGARDRAGLNRDNTGVAALFGVELGKGRILEGRLAGGVAHRGYEDPLLNGFTGLVAETALIWRPTRLIELTVEADRRLEETTVIQASGVDVTSLGVEARWSVRRFVALTALAGFENRRFRGAGRRDRRLSFGLGAEWSATRGTVLALGLRHESERSNAIGEDHDVTIISLSARHLF